MAAPVLWLGLLNKITGCESRTVPPLYVPTGKINGENRSLGKPGKADPPCVKTLRHKSEDLRIGVSSPLRVYGGVRCRRKTAAVLFFRHRSLLLFKEGNNMKNKKIVLAVSALALVIGILAGVYMGTRPQAQEGAKAVTILIVHKDGTQKQLEYNTDAEFLADLLLEKELVTGYASDEYGFTIESVDGVTADWAVDSAYWALYEGEEYATTSAAGIILTDGGVYKLVYETF